MKVPKGMTEQQVTETIEKICNRYAHKFQFAFYTPDDIRQEAFIIAMEALDRYDNSRPLENFLAVHVKNRLNNFKRDKYYRQKKDQNDPLNNAKKFLMEPLDISNIQDENESRMREEIDLINKISEAEIFNLINENLDVDLRSDYLRIMDDVYVPKPRREVIFSEIRTILKENGYEEG